MSRPLGMANNEIGDNQIVTQGESILGTNYGYQARLNSSGAWVSSNKHAAVYLEVTKLHYFLV